MEQLERFNRIYDSTRDALLAYLMCKTNAAPETEDLMQEVYRRLWLRLTRGALPILNDRAYLFSVAKKVLSRYYRKAAVRKSAEQPIPEDEAIASDDEPLDERLLRSERKDAIWRLLETEPEPNRRAFILYYGYDRPQKEIAAALGVSEDAVRQRLYRTRARIRALLETEEKGR